MRQLRHPLVAAAVVSLSSSRLRDWEVLDHTRPLAPTVSTKKLQTNSPLAAGSKQLEGHGSSLTTTRQRNKRRAKRQRRHQGEPPNQPAHGCPIYCYRTPETTDALDRARISRAKRRRSPFASSASDTHLRDISEHRPPMLKNCASWDSSSRKCRSSFPNESRPM